ncbi:MAG: DNA ligase D [Flavobacteriales bacterium]
MLAKPGAEAFDDPGWVFEIKWDGYRAIAETGARQRLYSRNGLSFEQAYPPIWNALGRYKERLVLDGEIVALGARGLPSFQLLQGFPDHPDTPLVYQVFDLLELDGKPLDDLPLIERKRLLRRVLKDDAHIRYCDHVTGDGRAFFRLAGERGLEGVIAKRGDSTYHRGSRNGDWLKIKHHQGQEVVIGGYTAPRGGRRYFGALLLGAYENGELHYVGHAGTGFDAATLRSLHARMEPLVRASSPFAERVKANAPAVWVKPELVANVRFTEWTDDGYMRHPVFEGLRIDKVAKDVHIERSAPMEKQKNGPKAKHTAAKKASASRPGTRAGTDLKHKDAGPNECSLKVGVRTLELTNQRKVFWPKEGFTKGDVIDYYDRMAPWILPHLKDRPQSLKRNPGGITDAGFYQKDAGKDTPGWVRTVRMPSKSRGGPIDYILCNDRATLLYLANLGCIEFNPWSSRVGRPDKPDHVVMDLDPGTRSTFGHAVEAALAVKVIADNIGAPAFCKTSGATGLHIYLPTRARYTYTELAPFMALLAQRVNELLPHTTTLERPIAKRKGRLYLDHLQNRQGQTLASVYSIRPVAGATVSTPLGWEEVGPDLDRTAFNIRTVPERVERLGDLFAAVRGPGLDLAHCMHALEALGT